MKRKCSAFMVATVFILGTLLASARAQELQEQLKKLETERAAAVVKGDVATLEEQTSDDYVLITMNGRMADKSQMLNGFKSGQSKVTSNDLSDLKVRVYGDTAVVTGKADVKGTLGGQDATGQILFTRVYVKKTNVGSQFPSNRPASRTPNTKHGSGVRLSALVLPRSFA